MAEVYPQNQKELDLEEALSAFVDGELSTDEEHALKQRMDAEPALAGVIQSLRVERSAPAAIWQSCEPDQQSVDRLIDKVDRAVDRQTTWAYLMGWVRTASATAACIVLGILIGRATFGRVGQPVDSIFQGQ